MFPSDSLNLPVSNGLYVFKVKAYTNFDWKVVFEDSLKTIVLLDWEESPLETIDGVWDTIENVTVSETYEFREKKSYKEKEDTWSINGLRFQPGYAGSDDQIAVSFHTEDDRWVRVYAGKRNKNCNNGIEILREKGYFAPDDVAVIVGRTECELILIETDGSAISVFDVSELFSRIDPAENRKR